MALGSAGWQAALPTILVLAAGEAGPAVRSAVRELWEDFLHLLRHPVYLVATLGCTFHTAVLGLYGELHRQRQPACMHVRVWPERVYADSASACVPRCH